MLNQTWCRNPWFCGWVETPTFDEIKEKSGWIFYLKNGRTHLVVEEDEEFREEYHWNQVEDATMELLDLLYPLFLPLYIQIMKIEWPNWFAHSKGIPFFDSLIWYGCCWKSCSWKRKKKLLFEIDSSCWKRKYCLQDSNSNYMTMIWFGEVPFWLQSRFSNLFLSTTNMLSL